ncbi:MAG TPA: hypothetical protein PLE61_03670 [Vicinamibacterales bacterium]|nr:hypothetical protein [Vicinamibacterales bacterium]HPW19891.1 hypothetical protein [Vicinamibacterales bacterium]
MSAYVTRAAAGAVLAAALTLAGCSEPTVDLATSVTVSDLTTGWFDAGVVDGKNKLVPSASFTVTNTGTHKLSALQLNSVFRFEGEEQELGSALVILRGADALAPSATSKPITVRGTWGFTGEQPRAQMLMHAQFKDACVQIFAKYGSAPAVKIKEAKIVRQLLTK